MDPCMTVTVLMGIAGLVMGVWFCGYMIDQGFEAVAKAIREKR